MTTRTVRPATAADVVTLVELRRLMFEEMGTPGVERPAWQRAAGGWFRAGLDDPDVHVVVADLGGEPVASAMGQLRRGCPSPRTSTGVDVYLSSVSTAPGHRRQGHAKACVEAVIAWAVEQGADRVELVSADAVGGLYSDLGFADAGYPLLRMPLSS